MMPVVCFPEELNEYISRLVDGYPEGTVLVVVPGHKEEFSEETKAQFAAFLAKGGTAPAGDWYFVKDKGE